MFCKGSDEFDSKHSKRTAKCKLHAAGGKMVARQYVEEFTSKIRKWASVIGDSRILSMVSSCDVRASEYFYHSTCFTAFEKKYEAKVKETNSSTSK